MDKNNVELSWGSLILRLAMAVLFGIAAASKFMNGYENSVGFVVGSVKGTFLPVALVSIYAHILPFAEALIAVWLLLGIKLKEAWIFTALVLITLGFGLMVGKQNATDIYTYILISCVGLYLSRFDCGCPCGKKK